MHPSTSTRAQREDAHEPTRIVARNPITRPNKMTSARRRTRGRPERPLANQKGREFNLSTDLLTTTTTTGDCLQASGRMDRWPYGAENRVILRESTAASAHRDQGVLPATRVSPKRRSHFRSARAHASAARLVITMAISLFLLLVLAAGVPRARWAAEALKLPSFLTFWQQQQQPAQAASSQQAKLPLELMSTDASSLQQTIEQENGNAGGLSKVELQAATKQRAASLKRPFQLSMLTGSSKYPSALFNSLPKSLFGRIRSSSPVAQSSQQQQFQHQVQQQQQALPSSPMPNSLMLAHEQIMPLIFKHRPHNKQFSTLPAGSALPAHFLLSPSAPTRFLSPMQPGEQHAITSFRAQPFGPSSEQAQQQQSPKKHALGYGETDDDFVILNAQQVPELAAQQPRQQATQPPRPAPTTLHPSDEYREMPAIVIADPEIDVNASFKQLATSGQFGAGSKVPAQQQAAPKNESQADAQEPATGEQQELVAAAELLKVGPTAFNQTQAAADNSTAAMQPDSSRAKAQIVGFDSAVQEANKTIDEASRLASAEFLASKLNGTTSEQQTNGTNASNEQVALGSEPEKGLLESTASVIVSSPGEHDEGAASQQEGLEQAERFILGPFKGQLGQDDLSSSSSQSSDFVDASQRYQQMQMAPNQMPQVFRPPTQASNMFQQQQQQPAAHQHHMMPSGNNLLGSAAANFLQQARQLIQLPFSHALGHNHYHHLHPQPSQQAHSLFQPDQLIEQPNGELLFAHSNLRPAPGPFFRPEAVPMQNQIASSSSPNHNFVFQQWQQPASASYEFARQQPQSNNKAHFQQATPQASFRRPQQAANGFNLPNALARPGSQNAYFAHTNQQQQMVFARNNQQFQRQQPPTLNQSQRFKSGLYQIEPPRLAASNASDSQQKQFGSEPDESEQQQKIDAAQEAADLNELSQQDEADEASENEDKDEQQTQKEVAVAELANQPNSLAASQQEASQLRVSSVFGVASNSSSFEQPQQQRQQQLASANSTAFGRKGQVFNEPISISKSSQDIEQALQQAPQFARQQDLSSMQHIEQRPQQPQQLLNTQVYTLPYTVTMHSQGQTSHFTPAATTSRRFNLRPYGFPGPQAQSSHFVNQYHQAMQQTAPAASNLPLTLVSVGGSNFRQQQEQVNQPVYQMPSQWSYSKESLPALRPNLEEQRPLVPYFYAVREPAQEQLQQQQYFHYQPLRKPEAVQQAEQQQPELKQERQQVQYELAVQHQPHTTNAFEQQQKAESPRQPSGAPQVRLEDVSMEPVTSDSLLSATSSTPPSTIVVNSTPASEADESGRQTAESESPLIRSQTATEQPPSRQQQQALEQFVFQERPEVSTQQEEEQAGEQKQQAARSPSSFCVGRPAGLYADVEQRCKAYYQCAPTGHQMFRCNNQTQFNQKTQNCDWWYNVDCGGRLGSPEDFANEQAGSTKSIAIDTSDSSGQQQGQNEQQAGQFQVQFSAGNQAQESSTTANANATTLAASEVPGSGQISSTSSQDQPVKATTAESSSQPGIDEQQSSTASAVTTPLVMQQQQQQVLDATTGSAESQPRVGALPSEVGQFETTSTSSASASTSTASSPTEPTQSALSQQLNELSTGARGDLSSGIKSTRRLIQSEFGASSKTARAISAFREKQRALRHQQENRMAEAREQSTSEDSSIFATTSANQGAIEYNPAGQELEFSRNSQHSTTASTASTRTTTESGAQTSQQDQTTTPAAATSSAFARQTNELRNAKLERRFGARLAAGRRQQ